MNEATVNLEQIDIAEVYIYHDRPLLFCGEDILGHKYLVVLIEDEEDYEKWLYIAMSLRRFEIVRSGGIDLATAFAQPENREAIVATIPFDGKEVTWEIIPDSDILSDWLPVSGQRLNLSTTTIKEKIEKRAFQAFREVVTLKLSFPQYTRSEAPATSLGEILIALQEALSSMINAVIPPLDVVGFNPGSFEVELAAGEQADFFQYSRTGEALNELLNLINKSENTDLLVERLKELPPTASTKFGKFMKTLSQQTQSTELTWGSPRKEFGGRSRVTADQANHVWQVIQETDQPRVNTFEVMGILRGLDLDAKRFRLVDENGKSYFGNIDKDSIDDQVIQNAQMSKRYTATIKETYTPPTVSKEEKLKYEMLNLRPK